MLGSSIYHIGFQQANWSQNQEMGVLTQAMYHARELAMTRMEEEADQLGADGVVGVRLDIGRYEWGADLAEFIAVGTAVKHRGGELHRAPNGRPFTSDLSGQDFSTLLRAGYRPVGLVMGNCVYHVAHQGLRASFKQIGRNQEMPTYTQALYEARELAMERMQAEATEVQANGIVGARIIETQPRLGLARDRVLRDRHRRRPDQRRPRDREARDGAAADRLSSRPSPAHRAGVIPDGHRDEHRRSRSSRRSTRTTGPTEYFEQFHARTRDHESSGAGSTRWCGWRR